MVREVVPQAFAVDDRTAIAFEMVDALVELHPAKS